MNIDFEKFALTRLLLSTEGIGPNRLLLLLSSFETKADLTQSLKIHLRSKSQIPNRILTSLQKKLTAIDSYKRDLEKELKTLQDLNANALMYWDTNYPEQLRRIYSPPIILYCLGDLLPKDYYSISVVGTRTPSIYGKAQASSISGEISTQGLTIVSGLARGIDTVAHKTAITNQSRTIAIIGSGLDVIYPWENRKLFQDIIENGAVISEYPLGTKPDARNFPKRNRIIAGISLGTLVIETRANGGAMQTAAYALEQNKEVFAIPGDISREESKGCNMLIQRGEAKLVTSCSDVITELDVKLKPVLGERIPKPDIVLTLFEEKVLSALSHEPRHIDSISDISGISVSECSVHLLSLEFKGLIEQMPGKNFKAI